MAARNIPLVNNAVRYPARIVQMLKQHPHTLLDETSESLCETTKALVRAGHRSELMEIVNASGLDGVKKALITRTAARHEKALDSDEKSALVRGTFGNRTH